MAEGEIFIQTQPGSSDPAPWGEQITDLTLLLSWPQLPLWNKVTGENTRQENPEPHIQNRVDSWEAGNEPQ